MRVGRRRWVRSVAHAGRRRVALLSALGVLAALALGAAPAASTVPPGCAGYTNFCDTIGTLSNGGFVLSVTVLPHANEPALKSFEFQTGTPVVVSAPSNLCHAAGTLTDGDDQGGVAGAQTITYVTRCKEPAKVGHAVYLCYGGGGRILGGVDAQPPPGDPSAPISQWLGPQQVDHFGVNGIESGWYDVGAGGDFGTCPVHGAAKPKKHKK
jgi:hypothetical protein